MLGTKSTAPTFPHKEPAMTSRGFTIRALGEVAIRCTDLDAMVAFYRDRLGLPVLPGGHRDGIVFFALGESYGGHTAVLALFRAEAGNAPATGAGSSLHHLALTVDSAEQQAVIDWYEAECQPYRIEEFGWVGWRGIFTEDPEGNTVELVARVASPEP